MKLWLGVLCLFFSLNLQAEIWRFALIGDVPYTENERRELPRMLTEIERGEIAFVAHIGDFKSGGERCDNALFEDRYQLFNNVRIPFVFVPGDNEWSDCARTSNGAYEPLERLGNLRHIFWKDNYSLGHKKLLLERQSAAYPEHSRFRLGPVLFVSFNLPGGNNNFGLSNTPSAEYSARNPVVLDWLKENFALARKEKRAGIALLLQADPGFGHFTRGLPHRGYRDFLELLSKETQSFDGQVVVVHGDSHISRIDHPLRNPQGKKIANFTRVETFGYPFMGWTLGEIDSASPSVFRFETHPWPTENH